MMTSTETPFTHASSVDSSLIHTVFWDEPTNTLVLEFNNGAKAGYGEVPRNVFERLIESDSPGKFYNSLIKCTFRGVKVGNLAMRTKATQSTPQFKVQDVTSVKDVTDSFGPPPAAGEYEVTVVVPASSISIAYGMFGNYDVVSVKRVR